MRIWSRLALVSSILLFWPRLWEQFEMPKAAAIVVLGVGALASAIAATLAARSGPGATVPPLGRWLPLDWALTAWLLIELVTTLTSQAPGISLLGDADQHEGVLVSVGLAGIYLSARVGTRGGPEARRTLVWFMIAALLSSAYGLLQALGRDPLQWQEAAAYSNGTYLRPLGTLAHPNLLGVVTSCGWAVAIARVAQTRARHAGWNAAAVVLGTTTVLTLSRAAWLGAAAGAVVAWVVASRASAAAILPRATRARLALGIGSAVALAVFASVGMFRERFLELIAPTSGPSGARLHIWRTALAMWRDHRWFGVGPDAFQLLFSRYQVAEFWRYEWGVEHFHAHSIYLNQLATRGLLGVIAAALVVAAAVIAGRRAWRGDPKLRGELAPLLGILAAISVAGAFGALGKAGATLTFATLGMMAALGDIRPSDVTPRVSRRRNVPPSNAAFPWAGVAAAALTCVGCAFEWQGTGAALRAREYAPRSAEETRDLGSIDAADRAVSLLRWRDWPENLRATLYLTQVSQLAPQPGLPPEGTAEADSVARWLDGAERSARRAIALAPQRAINRQTLGNIQFARARMGDSTALAGAVQAYRECWQRAPVNALAMLQFSFEAMRLGRADLAIEPARRAASLYPDEGLTQAVLGEASLAVTDTAAAMNALTHALASSWRGVPYARGDIEQQLLRLRSR